jgi:hypothetical protein
MPFDLRSDAQDEKKLENWLNKIQENDTLTKKEKITLKKLVQDLKDGFATEIQDLEPCTLDEFKIEWTEGLEIPNCSAYKTSLANKEFIETVVKELVAAGLIVPSKSSFAFSSGGRTSSWTSSSDSESTIAC